MLERHRLHTGFSAALCRGLIEAHVNDRSPSPPSPGFPRLYVAASLKHVRQRSGHRRPHPFSAALCRGLIEASTATPRPTRIGTVFRGFMSRPH